MKAIRDLRPGGIGNAGGLADVTTLLNTNSPPGLNLRIPFIDAQIRVFRLPVLCVCELRAGGVSRVRAMLRSTAAFELFGCRRHLKHTFQVSPAFRSTVPGPSICWPSGACSVCRPATVAWTRALVARPFFQERSIWSPPRARRPRTLPVGQASGSAGSKSTVPRCDCTSISQIPAA